jgi:hypothetical protein
MWLKEQGYSVMDISEAIKGWSGIDAAAIMIDRAHAAGTHGYITGNVSMDIKAAIRSVTKGKLVNMMKVKEMDGEHIRCMKSVDSERMVEVII